MATDTGAVEISVAELHVWRAAINSAFNQNIVLDLGEQYRRLSQTTKPSAMTKALERTLDSIDTYLESAYEEKEETAGE